MVIFVVFKRLAKSAELLLLGEHPVLVEVPLIILARKSPFRYSYESSRARQSLAAVNIYRNRGAFRTRVIVVVVPRFG